MTKRPQPQRPEVAQNPEALAERVLTTLEAANVRTAPPAALKAFKTALAEAQAAGGVPWGRIKTPLTAARDFMLEKAAATLGQAIPEIWRVQANDLRDELGYASAPALEKMLIDSAVLCWLRLALMELRYDAVTSAGNTLKVIEHTERRLSEAQKRYTRACAALAKVRKMKLPALQVNIAAEGGRQVNVA